MDVNFYESDVEQPISLDVEPVRIEAAPEYVPIPDAVPAPDENACLRPFANTRLNSRFPTILPDTQWKVLWQSEVSEEMPTMFVLRAADRIVLQQESAWQLLDHRGQLISRGPREAGNIVIDRKNEVFYICDPFGLISARDLSSGDEKFAMYAAFGEGFNRTILSRTGSRISILSIELPTMIGPWPKDPEYTIMEVQDLGKPIQVDGDGYLTSATDLSLLMCRTMPFFVAKNGDTLAMAAPDHIFLADGNLKITRDLQGEFTPLAMSLDEEMRIYLIVQTEEDQLALWVITPEGKKILDSEIPATTGESYMPPIVGYDHSVYITLGNQILAISSKGEKLWQQRILGTIAGASVTADNQLIVSAGNMLFAFDNQGERRFLQFFEGETLLTPPILTTRGRLLVVSDRHLYCLRPEQ